MKSRAFTFGWLLLLLGVAYAANVVTTGGQVPGQNVNEVGDKSYSLNAGGQYAGIAAHNAADSIALASQDTWYQILSFDTNGPYNGSAVPDHTNDHITIGITGDYRITFGISGNSSQSNLYEQGVRKNNGATMIEPLTLHQTTAVAGQTDSSSISWIESLTAGDTIEAWIMRSDGGEVEKTFVVDHVVLTVEMVGS